MTKELKPCPFCGGEAQMRRTKTKYCQLHGDPYQDYIAGCFKPHCPVKPKIVETTEHWAIKNWNTRN